MSKQKKFYSHYEAAAWLFKKGRNDEAVEILMQAVRLNQSLLDAFVRAEVKAGRMDKDSLTTIAASQAIKPDAP
jgi:tetratricopeptide (TPR) repeat protein